MLKFFILFSGVEVGMCWKFRIQVSEEGVHRPPVSGIAGKNFVPYSFDCGNIVGISLHASNWQTVFQVKLTLDAKVSFLPAVTKTT